jgi:hypothetical protein
MQLLEDGGSIYVLGPQPNSLMAENYVSNQARVMLDDEGVCACLRGRVYEQMWKNRVLR